MTSVIEFLSGNLTVESAVHLRTRLGIHDIPYLRLAERVISFRSDLVIRMNLHRQFVVNIQELDQKRELTSVMIVYILSYHPLEIGLHDLAYGVSGKPSLGYHRIFKAHIGKFPTFTDKFILTYRHFISLIITLDKGLSQLIHKRMSAPRPPRSDRHKLQRI